MNPTLNAPIEQAPSRWPWAALVAIVVIVEVLCWLDRRWERRDERVDVRMIDALRGRIR